MKRIAHIGIVPVDWRAMINKTFTRNSIAIMLVVVATSCSKIRKLTDEIVQPTAREVYKRDNGTDSLYAEWQNAFERATLDSLQVGAPYSESGLFRPGDITAHSYNINLDEGEILTAKVVLDSARQQVFIDIFELTAVGMTNIKSNGPKSNSLEHTVVKSGEYKVVIQPEIKTNTRFSIHFSKSPLYGFPVAGKGNSAIQSFWGYERDGGKRSHEGVDIFADRGTPVVAVADGTISNVGDRGLGGKQVWQRVSSSGHSIYYAHLDEIKAVDGTRVNKGDTVGFVGNSGNAKGGPPHLHFGIYKNFGGAVNPLAFIFKHPQLTATQKFPGANRGRIKASGATLRLGPTTASVKIGTMSKNDGVKILGRHKDWLHIQTDLRQRAFIHESLITL